MDLLERESCFADLAKWLDLATRQAGCVVLTNEWVISTGQHRASAVTILQGKPLHVGKVQGVYLVGMESG